MCECARLHGNLTNGTGMNKTIHKANKAYYLRSIKDPKAFTIQSVRQAQEACAVLANVDVAKGSGTEERAEGGTEEQHGGRSSGGGPLPSRSLRRPRGAQRSEKHPYYLKYVPVGEIARLPVFSNLGQLLGQSPNEKMRSASRVTLDGDFDCDGKAKQPLRCAEEIRRTSWYD